MAEIVSQMPVRGILMHDIHSYALEAESLLAE
jgi:hypothetical protein